MRHIPHEKKPIRIGRILGHVLTGILLLAAAVLTYLIVILVHPQHEEDVPSAALLPLATPGSAYVLEDAADLPQMLDMFPAPVLTAADSSPLQLIAGQSEDRKVSGGYARCLTLVYLLDSVRCTVSSAAPGEDPALYERGGFHLTDQEHMIAGRKAATFQSSTDIRVQLLLDGVLYTASLPRRSADLLETLLRSLAFTSPGT